MAFACAVASPIQPDQVGVAISRGRFGTHIGLVFTDAQKTTRILHLAWHKKVVVDAYPEPSPPSPQCWVTLVPDIPPTSAKAFVGYLRKVAKRQPPIRYGIGVLAAIGSFSENGDYKAPKGSDGLTCATFVTELFRLVALKVIKEPSWPPDVNGDWAEAVCSELSRTEGVTEEHVEAVRAGKHGIRIRPEEVGAAASSTYKGWPVPYPDASGGSAAVLQSLEGCCPQAPPTVPLH